MIPFNAPPVVGSELEYMQSAMASGKLCGDGGFTRRCQQWMEQRFGSKKSAADALLHRFAGDGGAADRSAARR
ncbi:hypothetical protein OJE16_23430 [Pantoea tagorei]